MSTAIVELANLVLRQSTEEPAVDPDAPPACGGGNSYDGRMGLRVSAVFVILIGSTLGRSKKLIMDLLLVELTRIYRCCRCSFPNNCYA